MAEGGARPSEYLDDEDAGEFEAPQRSLLDVLKVHVEEEGRRTMIARIIFVAQLQDKHSRTRVVEHQTRMVADVREVTGQSLTGLLLLWESCCLHVLEAPLGHLMVFAERLMEDLNQGVAPLREPRVASFMDDVEARAFTFWDSSNLNAVAADEIEPVSYNDAAEYMSEAGVQMLSLGKQLSGYPSAEKRKTAINKLATFVTDLPSPDRVTAMSLSDDLLSLAEFIEIFNEPIQLELDSDNVWPIPRSVAV